MPFFRGLFATSLWLAAACPAVATPDVDGPPLDLLAEPRLVRVGAEQIPRDVVASMAQDHDGFLWISTGDGLVRYDGYRFRPRERVSDDPQRRNLGWIRAMLTTRDGRVWFGTETNGLVEFDPRADALHDHRPPGTAAGSRPTITALAEAGDGALWVGSVGAGLQRFDPASGRFTDHRHGARPGSLPDDRVQALRVDRDGNLWVGTWQGPSRLRPGSDHFEPRDLQAAGLAPGGRTVQALMQAADGRLWVGTAQGDLLLLDPAGGPARRLDPPDAPAGEPGAVNAIVQAPDGTVWVGRSTGIDLHDASDGRPLRALRHDRRKPDGLAGNEVTSLVVDRDGWIWIGGFGLGLQRHDPRGGQLWVRGADDAPDSPLANPDVRALLALPGGELLTAPNGGGVVRLDPQLRVAGRLPPPQPGRPWRVTAMARDGGGAVWAGADGVLARYDRHHRLQRHLPSAGGPPRRLLAGRDGVLWAGMQDGLYRLAPGAAATRRVARADGQPLQGEVLALSEDADGTLWAGGVAGLFRLAPGADRAQPVESPAGAGLGNPIVLGLLRDRRGTLWVDTAVAGLHRLAAWDGREARFDRVSERHGIVDKPFGANLLEDRRGRIWTHMHLYDPAEDRLTVLTAADGVRLGTGWFFSYAALDDGRLLFGGSKGILVVEPDGFDASVQAPPLVVTELRINGRPQPVAPSPKRLAIQPDQRSLTLEFAALDLSDPGRLQYAYRLEGFDPDWIRTDASFRAPSYSNLDPGRYRLRVRGTNRSGVWSPHELSIELQVLPAWWQTAGFRVLLALLTLSTVAALVQWRTRALRRQQARLAALVQQRTAALEESSRTDPLTGLHNRRYLTDHIDGITARAMGGPERRGGSPDPAPAEAVDLVFFLIDIDHFKSVNDAHGHGAGDAVLMQMADRLRSVFRGSDHLVRWGGEEFLVVAADTGRDSAPVLAERMRRAVAEVPFPVGDGTSLAPTCSIGFCCFPPCPAHPQAVDWHAAVRAADAALYVVKSRGRNGWFGLLRAEAPSAGHARERAAGPLADWVASGELETAASDAAVPGPRA